MDDPEIKAMTALIEALKDLDAEIRERVIKWAAVRWAVTLVPNKPAAGAGGKQASGPTAKSGAPDGEAAGSQEFSSIAALYDAANPTSDMMRALVGGYWHQVCQRAVSFTGQQVNDELKNLGHPIGHITSAFGGLAHRTPVLARQIKKSGTSKQSRKQYQLTQAGIEHVHAMIAGEANDES